MLSTSDGDSFLQRRACLSLCLFILFFSPIFSKECAFISFFYIIFGLSLVFCCFNNTNCITHKKETKQYHPYFTLSVRSRWQPPDASHRWFRSYCHHPAKWNRPAAPEVSECKWNAGIGFPAQPGNCVLGSVDWFLWATPLCWNEESARIHTGTGNKNTTKFATYVFSCSYFPSHTVHTLFSCSLFW